MQILEVFSAYDVHLLLDQLEGYEEDGTLYVSAAQPWASPAWLPTHSSSP